MIILIIYVTAESSNKNAIEVLLQEGEKIKTNLKYLIYAVKKLNESPDPEAAATTQTKNTSDLIDLFSTESNLNKAKRQVNALTSYEVKKKKSNNDNKNQIKVLRQRNDKFKTGLRYLKYDVKKLNKAPAPQADVPVTIPDDHYSS